MVTRFYHTLAPVIATGMLFAMVSAMPAKAGPAPSLWGYGVKSCSAFLAVAPGSGAPAALADDEYLRYREWLAGLVTGLNLATGRDVLKGAELDAALMRIHAICQDHADDDFFNASLRLIRSLGQLSTQ